ncbi:MAG: AAA family ATPase [Bacilli bacterium]|nr:AAA family ATPase [Bacilli bacterium]
MNKLIAVVGMAGSGKSIATDYLQNNGWTKIYFGGAVYDRMRKEGIEITPESQKEYRENLRKQYGMGAVAEILKFDIENAYKENNTVLDGLYSWDEYLILKEKFPNLKLICIVCDKAIRYERVGKRIDRPFNHDEIIIRDVSEIENLAKGGPIGYADYYIFNNGNLEEYEKRLIEILNTIEETEGEK